MSQQDTEEDAQPIDTTDAEDAQLLLADPDDYHRAQRLKEIHDARRQAAKARREAADKYDDIRHPEDRRNRQHAYLGRRVHQYGIELEPLIDATNVDTEWPDNLPWLTFADYLDSMGYVPGDCPAAISGRKAPEDGKTYPTEGKFTTIVYRYLNRVLAEVRPIIEEDTDTKWEV